MANVSETGKVKVFSNMTMISFEDARFHYDGGLRIEKDGKLIGLFAHFDHAHVETETKTENA